MCRACWPSGIVDGSLFYWKWKDECGEKRTRAGAASILFASRKGEVRLKFPLPSDSWWRQQENEELNLVSSLVFCDVKQSFDNVSPENLSLVLKEMIIAAVLAEANVREQTRVSGSPCLFNLMMRSVFRVFCKKNGRGCGWVSRSGTVSDDMKRTESII